MSEHLTAAAVPTFTEAIEISGHWLGMWEKGEISDEVLADRVAELVASRDGARGFFVVALAGEVPLMDRCPEALVFQLSQAGEPVVDLTVKNLAMSTAMQLQHQRTGDGDLEAASERVRLRTTELLRQLNPELVKARLELLLAATRGVGDDLEFLARWGYDEDQRAAIAASIEAVTDS